MCSGIFPATTIESVRTCSVNEPIISCPSLQGILAGTSIEDVVSLAAFDRIDAASTADQVITALSVDAIPVLSADNNIFAISSLQLSSIRLAMLWSTDDAPPGVYIDRCGMPIAHGGICQSGRTMR